MKYNSATQDGGSRRAFSTLIMIMELIVENTPNVNNKMGCRLTFMLWAPPWPVRHP